MKYCIFLLTIIILPKGFYLQGGINTNPFDHEILIHSIDLIQNYNAESKKNTLANSDTEELIALFDEISEEGLKLSDPSIYDGLKGKIEKATELDRILSKNPNDENYQRLAISLGELKFHILVKTQERMYSIYHNDEAYEQLLQRRKISEEKKTQGEEVIENELFLDFETHGQWIFKEKVSWTLPYIQANQEYSREKKLLLMQAIDLLDNTNHPEIKKRGWTAIERMLDEIDLKKSESGYDPFQRNSQGIYTTHGEIIDRLEAIQVIETNQEIKNLSSKIIEKIRKQLSKPLDQESIGKIELSKEIQLKFKEEVVNKSSKKPVISATDQNSAEYWFNKAFDVNSDELKIYYYSKAIELDPGHSASYNNRGNAYQNLGMNENALKDYAMAIKLKPDFAAIYVNRANLYQKTGDDLKAIEDYTKSLQLEPKNKFALYQRGNSFKNLNKLKNAREDFSKTIELDSLFTFAYMNRGDVYRMQGNYLLAIQDYSKAISLDSTNATIFNNRGLSYKQIGKPQKAALDHQKAIELNSDNATAYYNLGIAYWDLQQWKKVIAAWEKCLEIEPDHEMAKKWLPKAKDIIKPRKRVYYKKVPKK